MSVLITLVSIEEHLRKCFTVWLSAGHLQLNIDMARHKHAHFGRIRNRSKCIREIKNGVLLCPKLHLPGSAKWECSLRQSPQFSIKEVVLLTICVACVLREPATEIPRQNNTVHISYNSCTPRSVGGPGWRSRYSDLLRAGRSGDRISVVAGFSAPVQTDPGALPASCTVGTGSVSRG